ncbi:nose resistant to fluoxetine protein 6-like [Hyposmocoma kahamanoa]|uniref:nose resistant to fluoxetine protein 6-like n=1 Tax=Hyposmocoma kahamanoa TaxID=1477025 RepID=UPI000E6DA27C|nr:nose resistant to fluoxetine protein 6-like [Hyposmocoma kahamanoa]
MYLVLVFILLVKQSFAVIYSLNETEYERMPPLYALDEYNSCLRNPGGVYCLVDVHLSGDNRLMHTINEYSAYSMKHFNHTQVHRGICLTTTCKEHVQNHSLQTNEDLRPLLEECLNESLWKRYELHGQLENILYCNREGDIIRYDLSDIIVAVVYLTIIVLNITGSLYDVFYYRKDDKSGNPYLLSFSIRRNWAKLTAPAGDGPDPRFKRLKLFNGLRTMTMTCVFFSHTTLISAYTYVDNPIYIEKSYEDPLKQLLFNGSLVTHTFFVLSAFLLAYNFQVHEEKHVISWWHWPKGMLLRWLRLTPTYALVLATICTWMRYAGSGPLWEQVVGTEATACREYWWAHVLYINNYVYDDALCAPQTWYLAADTQLFSIGLLVCVLARSMRARKIALLFLFTAALVAPAAHTYFQELEAVVIQSPEDYRSLYADDRTFRLLYVRGHTNLSTYTLGLTGGFLAYYWQKNGKNFDEFKKYRWMFWLLFPLGVAVILSGGLFYSDGEPASTALRVLYATFYKPVFQTIIVIFILGCIFKIESVYRGIVEWRGFTWTGRVSYDAFLIHTVFQRGLIGAQTQPVHMTDYNVVVILSATIFLSFMSAAMLFVCVEAPAASLTKAVLAPSASGKDSRETSKV